MSASKSVLPTSSIVGDCTNENTLSLPFDGVAFEVDYRKRYFDYVPILNQYHEQVRKRLAARKAKFHD